METLKIVGSIIVGIVTLGGGLFGLYFYFKKCFKSALKVELKPIQDDIVNIKKEIKEYNKQDCKNFLVKYLNDKEEGLPQNEACDLRAYEVKDKYVKYDGNSFIQKTWERVMKEKW